MRRHARWRRRIRSTPFQVSIIKSECQLGIEFLGQEVVKYDELSVTEVE
jgi:hypothetical protein